MADESPENAKYMPVASETSKVAPAMQLAQRSEVDGETVVADADGDEQQRGAGEDDRPAVVEVGRQETRRKRSMRRRARRVLVWS